MNIIQLNKRQLKIIDIVKDNEPITSEAIASILNVTRATLRSDLAILTMTGILDARPKVGYFYSGVSDINLVGNKLKDKKVEDIMSMPSLVKKDTSIYDVIVTMFLSDVGSVFIIDDENHLSGIVSRKDLLKATIGSADINKMPVGMIMTRTPNVITTNKEDDVVLAAKKIIEVSDINLVGNKLKDKKVEDIMSMPSLVKKDPSIYDVIVTMFLSDVGSVFIIDDENHLSGIVSRKDLLKATIGGGDINKIPIGMIMTRTPNVVTIYKEESIVDAAKKIIEHEVDSIPVIEIDEDHKNKSKVIGRISKTNITKLFLEIAGN